ncbi:solute carrier family 35 member F5-like [Sitophilus oryzae]|uniref:Solute carrier family 35 member F5-like n=1 Tax=Sitophilus oryzae TaxID=7048 RepID=A0A6J2YKQ8_SITOR|nr:solute carrier family 35 member F5-like [Sitophilus oryzae]
MDSLNVLTKKQKIILGLIVLILVNIIWVSSSELSSYMYKHETFQKPFFCTYFKTSMFAIYLFGFALWPPWKDIYCPGPNDYIFLETNVEDDINLEESAETKLSNPVFIPVKASDRDYMDRSSETESDDSSLRSVRFNKMAEVRHLSESEARDALLARLSYQASLRASDSIKKASLKMPLCDIIKVSFIFCFLVVLASYTYQVALIKGGNACLSVFFSTSTIFTLFLSGVYPSSHIDRFTVSKFVAVVLSVISIIIINVHNIKLDAQGTVGAALSVLSAFLYASYLVFLKRVIKDKEEKMDVPLFLGFVGLFNLLFFWPVLFVLHISNIETLELPDKEQLSLLILSTFIESFIPEALWLWSRFLTSSLVAIMAKCMIIPLIMIVDILFGDIAFTYSFFLGFVPMIIAFFMVVVYLYFDNWDPIFGVLHMAYAKLFRKTAILHSRRKETSSEQLEALIGVDSNIE